MLPLNFKIEHANRFRNRVAPFKRNALPVGTKACVAKRNLARMLPALTDYIDTMARRADEFCSTLEANAHDFF